MSRRNWSLHLHSPRGKLRNVRLSLPVLSEPFLHRCCIFHSANTARNVAFIYKDTRYVIFRLDKYAEVTVDGKRIVDYHRELTTTLTSSNTTPHPPETPIFHRLCQQLRSKLLVIKIGLILFYLCDPWKFQHGRSVCTRKSGNRDRINHRCRCFLLQLLLVCISIISAVHTYVRKGGRDSAEE